MKDNKKLNTVLNKILVDELKEITKNMFSANSKNEISYGDLYEEIYKEIEEETLEELKQAEWLIKRIIFLEVWRTRKPSVCVSPNILKDIYEKRCKAV